MDNIVINKKKMDNGDYIWYLESYFNRANITENTMIKLPSSAITIILVRKDEYVGHISANLYTNGKANLTTTEFDSLPIELNNCHNIIKQNNKALLVNEKFRRQGEATKLLSLLFDYLKEKDIDDLVIEGLCDKIAIKTYLKSGAELVGPNKLVYNDIKNMVNETKKYKK